jgi:hypothetical protein
LSPGGACPAVGAGDETVEVVAERSHEPSSLSVAVNHSEMSISIASQRSLGFGGAAPSVMWSSALHMVRRNGMICRHFE